jgi:hypothetical protein
LAAAMKIDRFSRACRCPVNSASDSGRIDVSGFSPASGSGWIRRSAAIMH